MKGKAAAKKAKVRGRTVYLDDALFERIIVAAHRRDRTISEYVAGVLDRQVPNHLARTETADDLTEIKSSGESGR